MSKTLRSVLCGAVVAATIGIFVAPAFAEAPQWLVKGSAVSSSVGVEAKKTLTLTDMNTPGGEASVKCEAGFDGTVGSGGKGEVAEILNTAGEKISSTPLSGLALACPHISVCEGTDSVWPIGLPWKTQLELSGELVYDRTTSASTVGYEVECNVLGIKISDECTRASSAPYVGDLASESPPNVLEVINEDMANCTLSKEASGAVVGEGLLVDGEGQELAFSGASASIAFVGDGNYGQVKLNTPKPKLFILTTTESNIELLKPTQLGKVSGGKVQRQCGRHLRNPRQKRIVNWNELQGLCCFRTINRPRIDCTPGTALQDSRKRGRTHCRYGPERRRKSVIQRSRRN